MLLEGEGYVLSKVVKALCLMAVGAIPPGIIAVALALSFKGPLLVPETGPACQATEESFAARLAKDPLITQVPPNMTQVFAEHAQPCTGIVDSAHIGGAYAIYAYPEQTQALSDVYDFYRRTGQANGWQMVSVNQLCGSKMLEGRPLRFLLTIDGSMWEGRRPAYTVEIQYEGVGVTAPSCEP
ncbi:hypothetical protein [Micromonospora sp. NPDC048830]|uniref:hypothetical protein n=1 Tax=Micromonospora sp. NPDC048830 TaxID=3364257 RepID=UPI0037212A9F